MGPSTDANDRHLADGPSMLVVATAAVVLLAPLIVLLVFRLRATPDATEFEREIERARVALNAGKARDSLVPLARAARLRPGDFAVHNDYCVAYGLLKQKRAAVAACRRALEIAPDNQLARNNLAWVQSLEEVRGP
jgi:Flp pilus assembly protein TadD